MSPLLSPTQPTALQFESATPAESPPQEQDFIDDLQTSFSLRRRCCWFFGFPCKSSWERIRVPRDDDDGSSWRSRLKELRKWFKLVVSGKWKAFIRRIKRPPKQLKVNDFRYDPLSYALNFDDGIREHGEINADRLLRTFTPRDVVDRRRGNGDCDGDGDGAGLVPPGAKSEPTLL